MSKKGPPGVIEVHPFLGFMLDQFSDDLFAFILYFCWITFPHIVCYFLHGLHVLGIHRSLIIEETQ